MTERDSGPSTAYLGLGSNLGDSRALLREALEKLPEAVHGRLLRVSPLYITEPWGVTDQPPFLNCAVAVETALAPDALLCALKRLEAEAGREAGPRWGPRPLDIDILLYDDLTLAAADLTIPHPRMLARRFVLQPLADIRPPGLPLLGASIEDRLAAVAEQDVRLLAPDGWSEK
ncbi:MAG: 2-amino-4-hydroxy-6-hydroxymethyldihydropteridine diphosphokinase [Chloroflexia bacterium]